MTLLTQRQAETDRKGIKALIQDQLTIELSGPERAERVEGSDCSEWLAHELVIFRVGPNPEPKQSFWDLNGERTIVAADPGRSIFANFLEMERGMSRVCFQKLERLIGEFTHSRREPIVAFPETR